MKRLIVAFLLLPALASADDVTELMANGMPGPLAKKVATGMADLVASDDITAGDEITSTSTTDIGWSVQSGANTACNTTCTFGCVFGADTATDFDAVGCADATADVCICAGAS